MDQNEHKVRDPAFDGRIREFIQNGFSEDLDMIAIEERCTVQSASLTGSGPIEHEEMRTRAKFPEKHGYSVLVALADYYGYELNPR